MPPPGLEPGKLPHLKRPTLPICPWRREFSQMVCRCWYLAAKPDRRHLPLIRYDRFRKEQRPTLRFHRQSRTGHVRELAGAIMDRTGENVVLTNFIRLTSSSRTIRTRVAGRRHVCTVSEFRRLFGALPSLLRFRDFRDMPRQAAR